MGKKNFHRGIEVKEINYFLNFTLSKLGYAFALAIKSRT
jgi:hypothetical protein